jgi:hypothetical protein
MKSEREIAGLRFQQYEAGKIHIHDDTKKLKFESTVDSFKKEISIALNALKKKNGAIAILGDNSVVLYLIRDQGHFIPFLGEGNHKSLIKLFVKEI